MTPITESASEALSELTLGPEGPRHQVGSKQKRVGGKLRVQPASQRVPDGGTWCFHGQEASHRQCGRMGGAFKYGNVGRMTEADTTKLRAATELVESPTDGDVLGAYLGQALRPQLPAQKLFEPFASSLLRPFS